MKRKALGKGLSSLIPEAPPRTVPPRAPAVGGAGLQQIDIDRIWPNRSQPRADFNEEQLAELAESMKERGVLQPVIVRRQDDGGFELIAGERRWRAAQIAGLLRIPAVVRKATDDEMLELALIENLQREELNPIEAAGAYQSLLDLGLSQEQVGQRVGKQRTTIANAVRLLNLPLEVQELVRKGSLSTGHARALLPLAQTRSQVEMAARIVRDGLSVRQVETIVKQAIRGKGPAAAPRRAEERDPNVVAAEEKLQQALSTKVRIVHTGKKGGRVEIAFYSDEELERVYQLLLDASRGR